MLLVEKFYLNSYLHIVVLFYMEKENIWCVQEKKNGEGKGGKHLEGNI